jgi:hypothetical protein
MAQSNSSFRGAKLLGKAREAYTFFRWNASGSKPKPEYLDGMFKEIEEYRDDYERITGRSFDSAHILEIGYGQRPLCLLAMISMGLDIYGIDLDMPLLRFSPVRLMKVAATNGIERAAKTGFRSLFFGRREQALLREALELRGYNLRIDATRILVGDAASYDYSRLPMWDFIYSQSVLEHIPTEALEDLVACMAQRLSPQGLAIVTPDIFTGICGGHLTDWYGGRVNHDFPRQSEPWEHLRKKRFTANTYLNRLPRKAYREIFSRHFDIIDERVWLPDLGRRWLTPEVREELAEWTEEELFSNKVRFILRPKHRE